MGSPQQISLQIAFRIGSTDHVEIVHRWWSGVGTSRHTYKLVPVQDRDDHPKFDYGAEWYRHEPSSLSHSYLNMELGGTCVATD